MKDGEGEYKPLPYTLRGVKLDADADLRMNKGEQSSVTIRTLEAKTKKSAVSAKGTISDVLGNMLMDMLDSPDIFFGRDGSKLDWGNSGATVFLYDYGIVGMILLLMMYLSVFLLGSDKKRAISAAIIISIIFMVDGHALWLCYFIPIYATAVSTSLKTDSDEPTI